MSDSRITFKEWIELAAASTPWEHNDQRKWDIDIGLRPSGPWGHDVVEITADIQTDDGYKICDASVEDINGLVEELFRLRACGFKPEGER